MEDAMILPYPLLGEDESPPNPPRGEAVGDIPSPPLREDTPLGTDPVLPTRHRRDDTALSLRRRDGDDRPLWEKDGGVTAALRQQTPGSRIILGTEWRRLRIAAGGKTPPHLSECLTTT